MHVLYTEVKRKQLFHLRMIRAFTSAACIIVLILYKNEAEEHDTSMIQHFKADGPWSASLFLAWYYFRL